MRVFTSFFFFGTAVWCSGQSTHPATPQRTEFVSNVVDLAVKPSQLPTGFKGMVVGYLDDFGSVYKPYGVATVDGAVPLNEKTLFGIGSLTKLFTSTLVAIANEEGLDLSTSASALIPLPTVIPPSAKRAQIKLLDLADHHAGLPKNEGQLYASLNDLYSDFAADPITCSAATSELIRDCGCCDPVYMGLLGLNPTCGANVVNPVYSCPTHLPTSGPDGWVYSNLGFEVLGPVVASWLGYSDWNQAILREITQPLNLPDTMPLESFGQSQIARAANHCTPATRASNVNCRLLDWLPIGNAAGGLFSTAEDILGFLAYNAYGPADGTNQRLTDALPIVHRNYERSPTGGQELGWQTLTLRTGELERWKDGSNGPFNSWVGYVGGSLPRMVVLLDNSGASSLDLGTIGAQILFNTGPAISSVAADTGASNIAQDTWAIVEGTNLVPATTPAAGINWSDTPEFGSGVLPTTLGNVSVSVNGKPAYVAFYCSAVTNPDCASDQVRILTPFDGTIGPVAVRVTNGTAISLPFSVNLVSLPPHRMKRP